MRVSSTEQGQKPLVDATIQARREEARRAFWPKQVFRHRLSAPSRKAEADLTGLLRTSSRCFAVAARPMLDDQATLLALSPPVTS